MEWKLKQQDLAGHGLAGICSETSRVVLRVILPNFTNLGPPLLSALLLANAAAIRTLSYRVDSDSFPDDGSSLHLVRLVAGWAACFLLEALILGLLLLCITAYVICVASLYRTGGDLLAADRVLKEDLPVAALTRLAFTFLLVVHPYFLVFFCSRFVLALLRAEMEIMLPLPLRLLGWTIAACAAVLFQLACVVSVLEDADHFGAVGRSWKLLRGKFWATACVFNTLDGCILAVLKAFTALVVDDALGLGLAFQVAAAAAMFVALCAVLVVTLVAQPVVYMMCKGHHQEVVDKACLGVDGDK